MPWLLAVTTAVPVMVPVTVAGASGAPGVTAVLHTVTGSAAPAPATPQPTPRGPTSTGREDTGPGGAAPGVEPAEMPGADAPGPEPPTLDDTATVPAVGRFWPVGPRPRVVRGWDPPLTPYGRGHRGVDLAAPPGTAVRAVAQGRVSFAGRVAGHGVVSVELDGTGDPPLRTTYTPVAATVRKGDMVAAGEAVGALESGSSHCATACLHWGLRKAKAYLDPLSVLPPWLLRTGPSRLLPLAG